MCWPYLPLATTAGGWRSSWSHQKSQLGEVDRTGVQAALHLLKTAAAAVQAPGAVGLHPQRPPQPGLQVGRDRHADRPFQGQADQQGVEVVVSEPAARLL